MPHYCSEDIRSKKEKKKGFISSTHMILETVIETKNIHPHYPKNRKVFFLNGK